MQPRYRNSSDGFRSGPSFGRYRSRGGGNGGGGGGFSRSYSKSYKNPPLTSRKIDILMEAGRLAAEYLVAKGMLPPNALPAKSSNTGSSVREFRGQGRENSYQPPYNEGRTSALARLGDSGLEAGNRKRRFDDDYDRQESHKNSRDRKRSGHYDREHSSDWGRERGRSGSWNERNRGYSDSMEGGDDFAPGHRKELQSGFDEVGSSISRVAGDEQHSKIEAVGESGSELDDTGSKVSSNKNKKDAAPEADADLIKEMDDTKVMDVEAGEFKGGESSDFEKKTRTLVDEDFNGTSAGNGDEFANDNQSDHLKLCDFTKVPRRNRSLRTHKASPVVGAPSTEESNKVKGVSGGEAGMAAVTSPTEDSPTVHGDSATCEVPANSGSAVSNSNNETPAQHSELDLQNSEPSMMTIDHKNRAADKESEKDANSSPARTPQQNDLCQLGSVIPTETSMVGKMPSPDAGIPETGMVKDVMPLDLGTAKICMVKEMSSQDVEMMEPIDSLKSDLAAKDEVNSASFKICDLNLMEAPEITEIPDDTAHISASPFEAGNELPVDFGLSAISKAKNIYEYSRRPSNKKVIPLIDLEDDSPAVDAACETSKPKNEMVHPSVENVLSQATNADDIQVMQDNYSFAISDYLGGDISCSPSVQAETGMGLPGPEGFPGVDDAIYGSLGDIGFTMKKQPQEFITRKYRQSLSGSLPPM